jgi:hypothetical protein
MSIKYAVEDALHILKPSVSKIAWAKKHIIDLKREADTFLFEKPPKMMVRNDRAGRYSTRFIKQDGPVPEQISLILGDAVHNLRCALDLTIFAIVGATAKAPHLVQFPFAWDPKKLGETITQRQVRYAGKNVIAAVEALKPYRGGNVAIEAVHLLDIADKHKLILTTARTAELTLNEFVELVPSDEFRHLRDSAAGTTISMHEDAVFKVLHKFTGNRKARRRNRRSYSRQSPREYEADVQPAFHICFGQGLPLEQHPIISTMAALTEDIEAACYSLAEAHARDVLGGS